MSTTPESFHRADDFESRIDSVLLPNEAWAVFAHLEKPVTVAEIARRLDADVASVQKLVDLLVEQKLARRHLVNWRDFLAQKGISTGPTRMSPAGPQPPPAVNGTARREPGAAAPAPATPVAAPAPASAAATVPAAPAQPRAAAITKRPASRAPEPVAADPEGTISFSLVNDGARRARRAHLAMSITFRVGAAPVRIAPAVAPAPVATPAPVPAASPAVAAVAEVAPAPLEVEADVTDAAPAAAPVRAMSMPRRLRPLIDAITRKGGGGLNGQLLVYRVFLRIPPALMYNAGIKSLSLIDDSLEINNEEVYDVLRAAARTVASLDLDTVAV